MCVAYTAVLCGKTVVLKTPLPDTSHADVAANDLEVRARGDLDSIRYHRNRLDRGFLAIYRSGCVAWRWDVLGCG